MCVCVCLTQKKRNIYITVDNVSLGGIHKNSLTMVGPGIEGNLTFFFIIIKI